MTRVPVRRPGKDWPTGLTQAAERLRATAGEYLTLYPDEFHSIAPEEQWVDALASLCNLVSVEGAETLLLAGLQHCARTGYTWGPYIASKPLDYGRRRSFLRAIVQFGGKDETIIACSTGNRVLAWVYPK